MAKTAAAETAERKQETLKAPDRKVDQLAPVRMQDAEFSRLEKVCVAQPNTLPEDLARQDYWAHVAPTLQPWARIEVRADDGTWLAQCLVLAAGRNWANIKVLEVYHLTTSDVAKTSAAIAEEYAGLPYEVRYRGEFELWSVIRKSDDAVMHEKEQSKAGADRWLQERLKADRPSV